MYCSHPTKCHKITAKRKNGCKYFEKIHNIYVDIKDKKLDNIYMNILSMGMSGDYNYAILCGSNLVRIGSSIFGPRIY